MVPLLERRWVCARDCGAWAVTHDGKTPHHPCNAMAGLMVPLITEGTKAKVEAVEREDFIGKEHVQLHEGRPVMSVKVTRDEGQDVTVFAPCATATTE